MSRRSSPISVFNYQDYRKFLKDWYAHAKKSRRGVSFRTLSQKAGFASPNFFKLVMDGGRNLTEDSLSKFVVGLGLNKQEQDFFRNLVFFNQAASHDKKDFYYQKLIQSRKLGELKPIQKDQYDYYSTWYHPVVRELLQATPKASAQSIASRINPPLSEAQVEKSLLLLEQLGFIQKNAQGSWEQKEKLVTTGPESDSLVLLNYHQNLLGLIRERLPILPSDKRDISALTLGIKKENIPVLKKKIQEFRQEILKLVSGDAEPDAVYLLGLQFFPVTITREENAS